MTICALLQRSGVPLSRSVPGGTEYDRAPFRIWVEPVGSGVTSVSQAERLDHLTVAAIARLDQRAELIRELRATDDRVSPESSDPMLILHAYAAWGIEAVKRLVGDFAFILHDARENMVLCARDPMGIEPLFYVDSPSHFACASSITALLDMKAASRELDRAYFESRLVGELVEEPATPYRDVRRLFPGCLIVATGDSVMLQPYWQPHVRPAIQYTDDREYVEHFRYIFRQAVADRLPADQPAGVLLSGGLDSTSIYAVAHGLAVERGQAPPQAISGIFERMREADEREYIQATVTQFRMDPHWVVTDDCWILKDWRDAFARSEEPSYGILGSPLAHAWFGRAAAAGVKIAFSGQGGDDVVGHSNTIISDYLRMGHWLTAFRESSVLAEARQTSFWRILLHYGLRPLSQRPIQADWVRAAPRLGNRFEHVPMPSLQKQTAALFNHARYGQDVVAPQYHLKFRYPFLDVRLVDFLWRIPQVQKIKGGVKKRILREALKGTMPERIRVRPDKTMHLPLIFKGLQREWPDIAPHFQQSRLAQWGLIDHDGFLQSLERLRQGWFDANSPVLIALVMELWLWQHD